MLIVAKQIIHISLNNPAKSITLRTRTNFLPNEAIKPYAISKAVSIKDSRPNYSVSIILNLKGNIIFCRTYQGKLPKKRNSARINRKK